MKRKTLLLLFFALSITKYIYSQECSCADTFKWLKETIEKNDAGFQYAIDKKGKAEYKKHSDNYAEKVKSIKAKTDCAETLSEWLRFFRHEHLWFKVNGEQENSFKQLDNETIKKQFKNWASYSFDEEEFETFISRIKKLEIQGIWISGSYKIGVKKVNDEYIGFIIEADGVYWKKSQIKFKIKDNNGKLSAIYFLKDHSAREIESVNLVGNNFLQIGQFTFKREAPIFPSEESIDLHFKLLKTKIPIIKKLTDNTIILRIPSFSYSEKKLIDSTINSNRDLILNTKNLIIDLRNNGGGSDESFEQLLPIIYTNPIRTVGVELLSTPLNNQRMIDIINTPSFSEETRQWAKNALEKLNKHMGEFVNVDSSRLTIEAYDTIYPYPKNVGIIINEGNGSTTEQFLLAAKQSKKVKLFGKTTMGILDISNMYSIDSPCNEYKLGYSLSRSMRIPDFTIDDKGVQPDYYIDESIHEYEWIDFVNKTLSWK